MFLPEISFSSSFFSLESVTTNPTDTKFSSTIGWHHSYEKDGKSQGSGNDAADGIEDPGDRDYNFR